MKRGSREKRQIDWWRTRVEAGLVDVADGREVVVEVWEGEDAGRVSVRRPPTRSFEQKDTAEQYTYSRAQCWTAPAPAPAAVVGGAAAADVSASGENDAGRVPSVVNVIVAESSLTMKWWARPALITGAVEVLPSMSLT